LPTIYVLFLGYQSLVGENVWNCKRELTRSFFALQSLSLSDFLANFIAYVPLGFLFAAPKMRTSFRYAFAFAIGLGFCVSMLMESLQFCLPGRIPSSLDLLSNTLGTALGAFGAWAFYFWDEGQVTSVNSSKDLPFALKSSAFRVLVLLAVMTWIAYQTKPWVFTLDIGQVRSNFSWLRRLGEYDWSWYGFARHACAWFAMLLAWRTSASVLPTQFQQGLKNGPWLRWCLLSLAIAVLSQVGLEARALGPEELLGMLLALALVALVALILRGTKHVQSMLSVGVLITAFGAVMAYQLEPGLQSVLTTGSETKKFSFLPKLGTQQLIHAIDYALFFAWFGVMIAIAACARTSSARAFSKLAASANGDKKLGSNDVIFALGWKLPCVGACAVAATEVAQFWVSGRSVDTSPVIFSMLGFLFANRLVSRSRPIL
jgi:VanZ family protein